VTAPERPHDAISVHRSLSCASRATDHIQNTACAPGRSHTLLRFAQQGRQPQTMVRIARLDRDEKAGTGQATGICGLQPVEDTTVSQAQQTAGADKPDVTRLTVYRTSQ